VARAEPKPEAEEQLDGALPGRTGRKSKAEELGLLKKKQAFLRKLPALGARATYAGCQDYLEQLNKGFVRGLLSGNELDRLQKSVALVLRALRQRHQSGELEELEALLKRSEGVRDKARARAKTERDRTR
jgi:hypothetical protein